MKNTFVYFNAILILLILSSFSLALIPTYGQHRMGFPESPHPVRNNYGEIDTFNQNGYPIEVVLIARYGIGPVELNIRDETSSSPFFLHTTFDLSKRIDFLNYTRSLQAVEEGVYEIIVPTLLYSNVGSNSALICIDIIHSLDAPLCSTVSLEEPNYTQRVGFDLVNFAVL
jgi:hypothetical protein